MNKISELIAKEFDTRTEVMIATYIMDSGYNELRQMPDEEIDKLDGNGLMTKDFVQALVRTSKHICEQFSIMDILIWIRTDCWFNPFPKEFTMNVNSKSSVAEFIDDLSYEYEADEDGNLTIQVFHLE